VYFNPEKKASELREVEALLEQYKEHKWSYLNWQLDLTNSTHIPDTAVFTLVVT